MTVVVHNRHAVPSQLMPISCFSRVVLSRCSIIELRIARVESVGIEHLHAVEDFAISCQPFGKCSDVAAEQPRRQSQKYLPSRVLCGFAGVYFLVCSCFAACSRVYFAYGTCNC